MHLLYDDYEDIYVWVSELDENEELSPRFDFKEDAERWKERMREEINK